VSPAVVLDAAAVVSTALLSFLAQAAIASEAKVKVAILNLGPLINMALSYPLGVKKNRSGRRGGDCRFVADSGKKRTHQRFSVIALVRHRS
jgi:hypothetical protein